MQEIDKLESREALLDQFGERGVKNEVVCVGERDSPGLLAVSLVALVEGRQVAPDGQFPVDHRKLRAEVGLVKVVGVLHVKTAQTYIPCMESYAITPHSSIFRQILFILRS